MRPCQHCGIAILLNDAVCPQCGGEQAASVGGGTNAVAASPVADDRTVAQRQAQVQRDAENWLIRTLIIVTLSLNGGLVLFGCLVGGVEGAASAMFLVAVGIVLSWIFIAVIANGLPVGGSFLHCIVIFLVILNAAGAYWLERMH